MSPHVPLPSGSQTPELLYSVIRVHWQRHSESNTRTISGAAEATMGDNVMLKAAKIPATPLFRIIFFINTIHNWHK